MITKLIAQEKFHAVFFGPGFVFDKVLNTDEKFVVFLERKVSTGPQVVCQ